MPQEKASITFARDPHGHQDKLVLESRRALERSYRILRATERLAGKPVATVKGARSPVHAEKAIHHKSPSAMLEPLRSQPGVLADE